MKKREKKTNKQTNKHKKKKPTSNKDINKNRLHWTAGTCHISIRNSTDCKIEKKKKGLRFGLVLGLISSGCIYQRIIHNSSGVLECHQHDARNQCLGVGTWGAGERGEGRGEAVHNSARRDLKDKLTVTQAQRRQAPKRTHAHPVYVCMRACSYSQSCAHGHMREHARTYLYSEKSTHTHKHNVQTLTYIW